MRTFSAGDAIGAGFRLIGREPLAFLMWALAYLVLGMLPQLWVVSAMFPLWSEMAANAGSGTEPEMADIMQMQAQIMVLQPISYLTSLVSQTLLLGAVYRAALYPEDRRFFYLRVGARELWMALVMLVLIVLMVIAIFVVMIPFGIVFVVMAGQNGDPPVLVILLAVLATMALFVWLMLRLSMAPVMSFSERNFRLFESWGFTAGQAGKMFLVALALVLIVLLAQMVIAAVLIAVVASSFAVTDLGDAWLQDPRAALAQVSWWVWVGGAALLSLFSAWSYTLFGAAWAEIYRRPGGAGEAPAA